MSEQRFTYRNRDGVRRTLIVDDERPGFVVHTEQAVDEILAGVARDREILNSNRSPNKHLGRFPVEVFERMVHEGWGPDDEAKWLNSSEAAPFRIWRGRV